MIRDRRQSDPGRRGRGAIWALVIGIIVMMAMQAELLLGYIENGSSSGSYSLGDLIFWSIVFLGTSASMLVGIVHNLRKR